MCSCAAHAELAARASAPKAFWEVGAHLITRPAPRTRSTAAVVSCIQATAALNSAAPAGKWFGGGRSCDSSARLRQACGGLWRGARACHARQGEECLFAARKSVTARSVGTIRQSSMILQRVVLIIACARLCAGSAYASVADGGAFTSCSCPTVHRLCTDAQSPKLSKKVQTSFL